MTVEKERSVKLKGYPGNPSDPDREPLACPLGLPNVEGV